MSTLETAFKGRSVLLVTHQLSGLERMDEILVLRGGRVVERGTHAELIARMASMRPFAGCKIWRWRKERNHFRGTGV